MRFLDTLVVDTHFRSRVRLVAEQLGGVVLSTSSAKWRPFADQLQVPPSTRPDAATLIVGPPAAVLNHARSVLSSGLGRDFGFVAPIARVAKPWQRATSWRDDTTLDLWKQGWSPITIDRLLVDTHGATVEFVIGCVRQTPVVDQGLVDQGSADASETR